MKNRISRGNALITVLLCTLVVVILGVGLIFASKIFGGGREMQNAVDSGALNVAKVALVRPGTKSKTGNMEEFQFLGFSPNDAKKPDYYLGNINRVWGQALIVALNEKAMEAEGTNEQDADGNANKVVAAAKAINDRVADSLEPVGNQPPEELKAAFVGSSNNNTLKMVSSAAADAVQSSIGAKIGYQDINGPANIAADLNDSGKLLANIIDPDDDKARTALAPTVKTLTGAAMSYPGVSGSCLKGYNDIKVDAQKQIYFVPLKPAAKPHMLSSTEFNTSVPKLAACGKPVNNSFFAKGKMREDKSSNMLDLASIALAEPVDDAFQLAIPRGYIKIKNWKGFGMDGTVLAAHTNNPSAVLSSYRGLHAAEYANHQLLMARSNFKGPGDAANDIFTTEMGNPYYGLVDTSGNPLLNANGDPVFGTQADVQSLINRNAAGNPPPNTPTCGGAFATPMPNGFNCSEVKTSNTAPAEISVSVDGNGNVVATNPSVSNALTVAIVNFMAKNLDTNENPWGSDIHPHLWSVDPQKVASIDNPGDFMKTGPNSSDPYKWMYTGMLMMPNNPEPGHYSRAGEPTQSPIVFGRAGTLWEYLQDKDPGSGSSHPQTQIINRLTQRILEIKPDFDRNKLESLLSSSTIDMNQDAYIYLDDKTNQMSLSVVKGGTTQAANGSKALPTWLVAEINAVGNNVDGKAILGKTIFYGQSRRITTQPNDGLGNFVENVPGDWGYTEPYTNADNPPPGAQMVNVYMSNRYAFHPCTGHLGQLAVLDLCSFIHHDGCDVSYSNGVTPEQCPCVTFPEGSFPAPGGQETVNTPNGWNQGGNPSPKSLPNCSHTGAC